MTGETRESVEYEWTPDETTLPLKLGPQESIVIVFSGSKQPPLVRDSNLTDLRMVNGLVEGATEQPGDYFIVTSRGRQSQHVGSLPPPLRVEIPWHFSANNGASVEMSHLQSWSESPNLHFYSGEGTYSGEFKLPAEYLGKDLRIKLNLGNVRETAEVLINDHIVGIAWKPPFVFDLTDFAVRGKNKLEVRVTNLLINRLLGTRATRLRSTSGEIRRALSGPARMEGGRKTLSFRFAGPGQNHSIQMFEICH